MLVCASCDAELSVRLDCTPSDAELPAMLVCASCDAELSVRLDCIPSDAELSARPDCAPCDADLPAVLVCPSCDAELSVRLDCTTSDAELSAMLDCTTSDADLFTDSLAIAEAIDACLETANRKFVGTCLPPSASVAHSWAVSQSPGTAGSPKTLSATSACGGAELVWPCEQAIPLMPLDLLLLLLLLLGLEQAVALLLLGHAVQLLFEHALLALLHAAVASELSARP